MGLIIGAGLVRAPFRRSRLRATYRGAAELRVRVNFTESAIRETSRLDIRHGAISLAWFSGCKSGRVERLQKTHLSILRENGGISKGDGRGRIVASGVSPPGVVLSSLRVIWQQIFARRPKERARGRMLTRAEARAIRSAWIIGLVQRFVFAFPVHLVPNPRFGNLGVPLLKLVVVRLTRLQVS
jgi:hypothetical protein